MNCKRCVVKIGASAIVLFVAFSTLALPSAQVSGQQSGTVYVDASNTTGIEDGTADHPYNTIQEGIDAALSGDTVQVAAGIYYENIALKDGVKVQGAGAEVTIIDGGEAGSVVTAVGVGANTLLDGFTVTNGYVTDNLWGYGGGISVRGDSSLTISNNVIAGNESGRGGGIAIDDSSPTIFHNRIESNHASGFWGGGIAVHGASLPEIANNILKGNSVGVEGGGISFYQTPPIVLRNNVIVENSTSLIHGDYNRGGGIFIYDSDITITNNTIAYNRSNLGNGVYGLGYATAVVENTILWHAFNDVMGDDFQVEYRYSRVRQRGAGDPQFAGAGDGDYHLGGGSPCIDAGDPDLALNDPDGTRNDIGAYGGPEATDWYITRADFSADTTDGDVPLQVNFTDRSVYDISNWSWDFGDGGTSTQQSPSHTYTTRGVYPVSLEVTGPAGTDVETKVNYISILGFPADWTAPVNASNTPGISIVCDLAVDPEGTVHVVFEEQNNITWIGQVFYCAKPANGPWSTPVNISNSEHSSLDPKIAVDSTGMLHVAWKECHFTYSLIRYTGKAPGGSWSTPVVISGESEESRAVSDVVTDNQDNLHVAWVEAGEIYYATKASGGSWSASVNVSQGYKCTYPEWPHIVSDSEGNLHIVWVTGSGYDKCIMYLTKPMSGSWSEPKNLYLFAFTASSSALAVDEQAHLHVAWSCAKPNIIEKWNYAGIKLSSVDVVEGTAAPPEDGAKVTHFLGEQITYVEREGAWTEPEIMYATGPLIPSWNISRWPQRLNISTSSRESLDPSMTLDVRGMPHIVWQETIDGNSEIFYATREHDGSWSTPVNLSNNEGMSGVPVIVSDASGGVHLVWSNETADTFDIMYTARPGVPTTGTVEGKVYLQGRSDHSGVTISVGGHTATTLADGGFRITGVAESTYVVNASMPGYLDAERGDVLVQVGKTTLLPDVTLLGGNAIQDDTIDILDLAKVVTNFNASVPPADSEADINGDGLVDIYDLVLVGINFGKRAPSPWPP